jgi:tetratricopeptide (TPR) repeat protein
LLARGSTDEAREGFLAAVELLLPLRNRGKKELAVAYHDLGVALKQLRSLEESESYLRMSLEINRSLKAREEEANNLYMLASVVHIQGRSEEAMELLEAALVLDRELERSLSIAQDLFALGSVAEAIGLYEKAFTSWGQSFMIYQAMELTDPAVAVLRRLARLAAVQGDTAAQQRYLKAAEKLEEGALR